MSAPNLGAPKYIKQALTERKRKTDYIAIIVGTSISHCQQWIGRPNTKSLGNSRLSNRHKENIPTNTSRTYVLTSVRGTFSGIDHMLGHRIVLIKLGRLK